MLERIVALSVRRSGVVLVVWALVARAAVVAMRKLSIDAVPDVTNTQVSVLTSAPGLSPVEVERYLTFPIETAMNGVPGVAQIRSISRTAVSAVTSFSRRNRPVVRATARQRTPQARRDRYPARIRTSGAGAGLDRSRRDVRVLSDLRSALADGARTLLDWTVAYRLRSVPGVVEVNGMGGEAKQYQVVLDPRRLAGYHLSLQQVSGRSRRTTRRSAVATSNDTARRT